MDGVSDAGGSVAPPPCCDFDPPEKYKVRRCKYCRAHSWMANPISGDQYPAWNPVIPWADGSKTKPKGNICKLCVSACA